MLKSRRAVSNVVATMLIFALMIVSMGVLYSQIAPTIIGFDARSRSTGQEFVLLSLANEMQSLGVSPENSQARISIVSDNGLYNVSRGKKLTVEILNGSGVPSFLTDETIQIGDFTIDLDGSFQYEQNEVYFSRTANEDSLLVNDTHELNTNYVSKVNYAYTSAHFEFYPLSNIDVHNTTAIDYFLTISMIMIDFTPHRDRPDLPADFAIQSSDFTLRLRRLDSTIITSFFPNVLGPIIINQEIDDDLSPVSFNFGGPNIINLTIKFIIIPILFSI